jgi:hypothetical protein
VSTTTTTSALGATAQLAAARRTRPPPLPPPSRPRRLVAIRARLGATQTVAASRGRAPLARCICTVVRRPVLQRVADARRRLHERQRRQLRRHGSGGLCVHAEATRHAAVSRRALHALADCHDPRADQREVRAPLPHLHRDWAHPSHICTETGLTPPTSAPGLGSPRSSFTRCVSLFAACCALLRHAVPSARSVRQGGY